MNRVGFLTVILLFLISGFLESDEKEDKQQKNTQIVYCINLLGSPDFKSRESAQEKLEKEFGMEAWEFVKAERSNKDLEIARRSTAVFEKLLEKKLDLMEPFPWLDSLYYDVDKKEYNNQTEYYKKYHSYIDWSGEGYPWEKYRRATRTVVSEWLERGEISEEMIRWILKEMKRKDDVFLTEWSKNTNPVQ